MELDIQLGKHPLWIVRHKASSCKASLYIFLGHRSEEGFAEGTEELKLADVGDMHPH